MARRIWIIAKKDQVEQSDIDDANTNNCPEIANGIPPALEGIVTGVMLPYAYEEPTSLAEPPTSTHISILSAVDVSKARPAQVKRKWEGEDYYYDCFVTETVKDQYQVGNIQIGDYVLVHFDDIGEQVVTAKVYKSWN